MTKCFPKDYMKLHNPVYWWEITVVDLSNDKHLRRTLTRTRIWTRDTEILNKWGWDTGKICLYGYFFCYSYEHSWQKQPKLIFYLVKISLLVYFRLCPSWDTGVPDVTHVLEIKYINSTCHSWSDKSMRQRHTLQCCCENSYFQVILKRRTWDHLLITPLFPLFVPCYFLS